MNDFPKPCGRLDHHDPHNWTCPEPRHPSYRCIGRVLLEGGYWADWDAKDDAVEDRADRDKRDVA